MGVGFSICTHTRIVYPSSPVHLTVRRIRGSKETTRCSLRKVVEKRVPTLFVSFHPPWWLYTGNLQTIYSISGTFSGIDDVQYSRSYLLLVDGAILCLDHAPIHEDIPDDAPIVVMVTAMAGGAYEPYVRAISAPSSEAGGLGYRTIVVNIRGTAGLPPNSPELYHQRATDDLRQALIYIASQYPEAPLLGLGFSIGANILIQYLAEEGESSRFINGCALSCPWDLDMTGDITENALIAPYTYIRDAYTRSVHFLTRHIRALVSESPFQEVLRIHRLVREGSLLANDTEEENDHPVTLSPESLSKWLSLLDRIRVPLLTVNARDDPITHMTPLGVDSPNVIMAITPHGGHLGWFEGRSERWSTQPVIEWLRIAVEDIVVLEAKGRPIYRDKDGFLKEQGRADIGCLLIQGGLEGLMNGGGDISSTFSQTEVN